MFQIEPERRRGVESTVRQDRPTDRRTYRQPTDRSTGEKSHKKAIFLWQKQIQRRLRKKAPLIADKVKKERIKSIKSEKRRKKNGEGKTNRVSVSFVFSPSRRCSLPRGQGPATETSSRQTPFPSKFCEQKKQEASSRQQAATPMRRREATGEGVYPDFTPEQSTRQTA